MIGFNNNEVHIKKFQTQVLNKNKMQHLSHLQETQKLHPEMIVKTRPQNTLERPL